APKRMADSARLRNFRTHLALDGVRNDTEWLFLDRRIQRSIGPAVFWPHGQLCDVWCRFHSSGHLALEADFWIFRAALSAGAPGTQGTAQACETALAAEFNVGKMP